MLGYSPGMHKPALLLALLVLPLAPAAAQPAPVRAVPAATAPTPPPDPLAGLPPVPAPSPALRAAFARADAGQLDDTALAAFANEPLAAWLEYAALRPRLASLPLARGAAFLARQGDSVVGRRFRADWLATLGQRREWAALLAAWDPAITDPALRCLAWQARLATAPDDTVWQAEALALWRDAGRPLPASCDPVAAELERRGRLDPAVRWQRIDAVVAAQQPALIRAIARGLPADEAALAGRYAAFFDAPDASAAQWPKTARSRQVASAGLRKLARANPGAAEALLPAIADALALDADQRGQVLAQIALQSAAAFAPEAAARLARVPASAYDANLHEWRVREALARADWAAALAAIRAMPEAQRSDSRWRYFAARLSELTGDPAAARTLYAQAARSADFHGFLAADRLDLPYALCPLAPELRNPQALARDPALVRALQLSALGRREPAQREWNALLARLDDAQRRTAVALAQANGWFDRGVFGLVNVGERRLPEELRLYTLRFPLHHADTIRREAERNRLDPAWVAAEIRAESIFDPNARSSADARGLMQLLPGTGAAVARQRGLTFAGSEALYDPDLNIALGSAYLRQLLDRYDGLPYRAIAAYNAGPAPVARWLAARGQLDPDFWIETIGYRETRDYVARVLAFSVLYDWRLRGDARRLSDRLRGREDGPRKTFTCTIQ